MSTLGIVINPLSGRDVRRLAARAGTSTPDDKRNQVERAIVGAAAAGVQRVVMAKDPFRIADTAGAHIGVDIEIELLDVGGSCKASDTDEAVRQMRALGCGALLVLGGDGTSRRVAKTWGDAPIVPISTGTNNVFPVMVEATTAGAAAGLVAAGKVTVEEVARPCKRVAVEIEGEEDDVALIDAVHLVDDAVGNYMPFEPDCLRRIVLARAEPWAVGMSPIGGLLHTAGRDDDFGVDVELVHTHDAPRRLLVAVSPGLYAEVGIQDARELELGKAVVVNGPGVLAFDGDRERTLAPEQHARMTVLRDGPRVIDVAQALRLAAERDAYRDRAAFADSRRDISMDCC